MSKKNKIIYWIATIWLSLGMFSTGIVQLLRLKDQGGATAPGGAGSLTHLGYPIYLLSLLGTLKILGVITVLVPKFTLAKEWAYAGFFFIMTGAIFSHIETGDPFSETFPSLLLLILTVVSWYFRPLNRKIILANQ